MDIKVKIYGTPTCNYCQQAKAFFTEKGVAFEALDVMQDKDALQEMRRISGGARTVPVIAVGDTVLVGFDRVDVEKALTAVQ